MQFLFYPIKIGVWRDSKKCMKLHTEYKKVFILAMFN
jgi:hypothetical protein